VGLYSDRNAATRDHRRKNELTPYQVRQHALFDAGRAVGYAGVGAPFGLLGTAVFTSVEGVTAIGDDAGAATGIFVGAIIVAGGRLLSRVRDDGECARGRPRDHGSLSAY
jgi:sulfite exporter TauE/SafE